MPNHGKNRASQAKTQEETKNQASSSHGSNAAPSQPTPLTRAALADLALQRQKKRADRVAQKKARSEALKNTGNNLFQGGDYEAAVDAYQEAIGEYKATAVLYSNLAAAYLKLEEYDEAEDAATEALVLDPKMVKARYRRGLARKESGQYRAALIDFQTVLEQDSTRVEARDRITETQFFYDKYGDDEFWDDANTGVLSYGWPYVDDEPMDVSDTESDSTDCNHIGNGVPCRFYNHGGCSRKDTCRYSHAPDNLSERDELGRNVCVYSLLDSCKFGEAKCVYSHDRTFLPHGWWHHPEHVAMIKERLNTRDGQGKGSIVHFKTKTNTRFHPMAADSSKSSFSPNVQAASTGSRFVLVLALDNDLEEEYKLPTLAALQAEITVKKAVNVSEAVTHLASSDLQAVFVADAAITDGSHAQVLKKLVEFARGGGSVVMGGSFSAWVKFPDFGPFFSTSWGLNWKSGSYTSGTFKLNKSHNLAKSGSSLPQSYSMKALHVQGAAPNAIVYKEAGIKTAESPAVQVPFGKGYVGYIGDVNWEDGSISVLHAMLHISASKKPGSAPPPITPSASAAKTSSSGETSVTPAILKETSYEDKEEDEDTETFSEAKFVLILALDGGITDSYKQPTIDLIKCKSPVKIASAQSEALRILSSDAITGVFVADAGITNRKNAQTLAKLVEYAKAGGSVIVGGAFSTFVKPKDMGTFFLKSWGVPWKPGSYHRTTFSLNPAHELAKSNPLLAKSYSMKALHVKDISPDVVVYRPTSDSRLESLVFGPSPITNMNESPAVRTRVGKGYLSYIGDVNWEDDSAKLLLAMMGLLGPQQAQPKAGPSKATTSTKNAKPAPSPVHKANPVPQAAPPPTAPVPAPTTSTASSKQKSAVPVAPKISKQSFLLLVSLENDEVFATSHANCLSAIRERVGVFQALTVSAVLTKLDDKNLIGVFVTDTGIVKPEHKEILPHLLKYVKQGGTVVVGGTFSSFVSVSDMDSFFNDAWGPSWKSGAYHRTRFLRNDQHDLVSKNSSLPSSYSMKALHLRGLASSDPVYLPADDLQHQTSLPFNDHTESPVVRRKIGDGYFGYVGDVDAEMETIDVVLAMFGLLDELKTEVDKADTTTVAKPVAVQETKKEASPQSKQKKESPAINTGPIPGQPCDEAPASSMFTTAVVAEEEFRRLPIGPTRRPFMMILSFGNEKFFTGVQGDLLELLQSKLEVLHGLSHERVLELLGSQDLVGILITDAAIVGAENAYILSRLVAFTKAGGTVVMGGSFSSHVRFDQLGKFFQDSWGLPWQSGDYTRCEITVNSKHELGQSSVLPSAFTMKGLFVSGVTPQTALYVPAQGYAAAKKLQSPVASAHVGKGRLGYIGDVGLRDEHSKIVLAMFGLTQ